MSKIDKANRVIELIEHPEFKDAIAVLRQENIKKWQQTNIQDHETQVECRYFEKAINDLVTQFKRVIRQADDEAVMEKQTNRRKGVK